MLGQVGTDSEGKAYLVYLDEHKVLRKNIISREDVVTGQAYIFSLVQSGENSIIIVGGANQQYSDGLPEQWK